METIIGNYIAALREAENLDRKGLAAKVGLSYQRLSAIETGNIGKNILKIIKPIADYFGLSSQELVDNAIAADKKNLKDLSGDQLEEIQKLMQNAIRNSAEIKELKILIDSVLRAISRIQDCHSGETPNGNNRIVKGSQ